MIRSKHYAKVGNLIRKARRKSKITLDQLSDKVWEDKEDLSKVERGVYYGDNIDFLIYKMANELGMKDLVHFEEERVKIRQRIPVVKSKIEWYASLIEEYEAELQRLEERWYELESKII